MKFDEANWRREKILLLREATKKAKELKKRGKRLVTVNGAFDLLHIGHLDQLEEARKQGDVLFVGVNSDASIKEYKGENRPYVPAEARAAMLAALTCVDFVMIIEAESKEVPSVLLQTVRPDIHVNGAEYGEPQNWIEWPVMQEVGARGYAVKKRNDISTSEIISLIREQ